MQTEQEPRNVLISGGWSLLLELLVPCKWRLSSKVPRCLLPSKYSNHAFGEHDGTIGI